MPLVPLEEQELQAPVPLPWVPNEARAQGTERPHRGPAEEHERDRRVTRLGRSLVDGATETCAAGDWANGPTL